ncbi:MAG: methyltransferase [Oscillospiraceae bacterium]|nr:methyltransferase [Oscillospiraceae bacterium]
MKFDIKEIENAKITYPDVSMYLFGGIEFDSPVTSRENLRLAYQKKQLWMPATMDKNWFCPVIIPDNPARAFVIQGTKYEGPVGGDDMFGIYWEYVPSAHGSIVRPGNPTLTDVTKWREVIHFPDVDSWDWEGSAKANKEYLINCPRYINFCIFTGWFERLISFMDFGPAAYALMNRKTKDYVKELMDALSDLWIDIVDHCYKYYGNAFEGFCFHDDWGAQDGPFFNERIVREMLVPYMRRVTDHIHELGYNCDLHSCGKVERLIPCIIEAGWDGWDGMVINDYHQIYADYGDKLIMQIPVFDCPADADVETQKEAAARYADEFANKDKPACFSHYGPPIFDFQKELYKITRIKFSDED